MEAVVTYTTGAMPHLPHTVLQSTVPPATIQPTHTHTIHEHTPVQELFLTLLDNVKALSVGAAKECEVRTCVVV